MLVKKGCARAFTTAFLSMTRFPPEAGSPGIPCEPVCPLRRQNPERETLPHVLGDLISKITLLTTIEFVKQFTLFKRGSGIPRLQMCKTKRVLQGSSPFADASAFWPFGCLTFFFRDRAFDGAALARATVVVL